MNAGPQSSLNKDCRGKGIAQVLLVAVIGLLISGQGVTADDPSVPIRLLSSSPESAVVAFTLPDYALRDVSEQGRTFTQIDVLGWMADAAPGEPQLPQASTLVGLPPGSTPSLRVVDIDQVRVHVRHPIYPAPQPVPAEVPAPTGDRAPTGPTYEFALNEDMYAEDTFHPLEEVRVTSVGWARDHYVARVTFHPMRYNPVHSELLVTKKIVVEIRFESAVQAMTLHGSGAPSPAFESALHQALLNYETARHWRATPPLLAAASASITPATQSGSYKVIVRDDGFYRLTYPDLEAAGLPVDSLDPRTFQLFEQDDEVAIQVSGQDDGRFDPGDSLLFYGQLPRSRYTDQNVYWLRYGETGGRRMATRDVTPVSYPSGIAWTTARYAENLFYDSHFPAADGDHWYAADVHIDASQTATLMLMPPATDVPTATLRVRLVGYTRDFTVDPDHHAMFSVNGHQVGDLWWDDRKPVTATLVLDRGILRAGDNQVSVRLPGDTGASVEGVWLDEVEIEYALQAVPNDTAVFWGQAGSRTYELDGFTSSGVSVYDVTRPRRPVQLSGPQITGEGEFAITFSDVGPDGISAAYLALADAQIRRPLSVVADTPSNLHDSANGADYLVVTHAEFADAVQPLAAYHQAHGLRVMVVDVQDAYDEFNGGVLHPNAIRDLVAYAYEHWQSPAPAFVLLVGDGHYDFLDHYGYGSANWIPPYLAPVDPWWGETAADNRYATVNGDDPLPDVLLGRLPVTSAAETAAVVRKIIDYGQQPMLGDWNASHVFVADDHDAAGDFAAEARAIASNIGEPWTVQDIFLDNLDVETAHQNTLSALNRGALLVSYVGHSSWHQWAAEALLDIHDVSDLRNGSRWPVVLSMTCFTGFFHHPEYRTLDESLLGLDGGGAVATWSPSGQGLMAAHHSLHQGFYEAVFSTGQIQLGSATLAGKLNLYRQPRVHHNLLDTYHLFGDPAMSLNLTIRPWPYSTLLPLVAKNQGS